MKKLILAMVLLLGAAMYAPAVSHAAQVRDLRPNPEVVAQAEGEHKDVPWIPIVILAFIVPIAVLVVPSFFLGSKNEERGSQE